MAKRSNVYDLDKSKGGVKEPTGKTTSVKPGKSAVPKPKRKGY